MLHITDSAHNSPTKTATTLEAKIHGRPGSIAQDEDDLSFLVRKLMKEYAKSELEMKFKKIE